MQVRKLATVLLIVAWIVAGCAMLQPQLPQTSQDKSSFFMSYYMAQLQDYETLYKAIESGERVATELDIKILETKYVFLQNAWKPIALYDSYASAGTIPPATLEAEIYSFIDMLEQALK